MSSVCSNWGVNLLKEYLCRWLQAQETHFLARGSKRGTRHVISDEAFITVLGPISSGWYYLLCSLFATVYIEILLKISTFSLSLLYYLNSLNIWWNSSCSIAIKRGKSCSLERTKLSWGFSTWPATWSKCCNGKMYEWCWNERELTSFLCSWGFDLPYYYAYKTTGKILTVLLGVITIC